MQKLLAFFIILYFNFSFSQVTDASGKKQGYWKKKDEKTNKLIYEGEFKDDKPIGTFKYYYANDSLQAIMKFKEGGKIAYAKLFHPTGKKMGEGKYINEIKDSTWLFYDEKGILISKDNYTLGKKYGKSLVFLPDGSIAEERNFKSDIQHGKFIQYFDGKKIKGAGEYSDGNLEGRVTYFFPNGIEVATGFYAKGQKNGPWIYRNQKGAITDKELYKNGKLASKKETEEFFSKNKSSEAVPKNIEKPKGKK
jgi:antitoxin component YwqK of YwqJK toxin-antitoxin module